MVITIFTLLLWIGHTRFDVMRELVPVSRKEWERIYRRDREAIWHLR